MIKKGGYCEMPTDKTLTHRGERVYNAMKAIYRNNRGNFSSGRDMCFELACFEFYVFEETYMVPFNFQYAVYDNGIAALNQIDAGANDVFDFFYWIKKDNTDVNYDMLSKVEIASLNGGYNHRRARLRDIINDAIRDITFDAFYHAWDRRMLPPWTFVEDNNLKRKLARADIPWVSRVSLLKNSRYL